MTALACVLCVVLAASTAGAADATIVCMNFSAGPSYLDMLVYLQLYDDLAPITVTNFLNYVNPVIQAPYPRYDWSVVHRLSYDPQVIQGGGYYFYQDEWYAVETDLPISNEFDPDTMSNVRGTIAMARGTDLGSATSQWFINYEDNLYLDDPVSPYCVFGEVVKGMEAVDLIASLPTDSYYPFNELPYYYEDPYNYLVMLDTATVITPQPGDANFDGVVNVGDLAILASHWQEPGGKANWCMADFNFDGLVNVGDLAMLAGNWNPGGPGGAAVPEPATMALLAAGAVVALIRRRR